jgi:outer membrane lipase/esterase
MKVWTEIINDAYKAPALCAYYGAVSASVVVPNTTNAQCNSYAVGGGRINIGTTTLTPFSIPKQLADLATNKPYTAGDLLLVDGGGNDAASLTGAYLKAPTDSAAAYIALTSSLLGTATVLPIISTYPATGTAAVGTLYMQALADKMYDAVKTQALDKGAPRVILLNMPDITNTPRFQATLDNVALAYGGGTTGAAARAQVKGLINSWVVAFNTQLTSKFTGNSKVAIVDFYGKFNDQIANPTNYGLTNVTTPACPSTGLDADFLPVYNTPACTADSLTRQTPPSGAGTGLNWWKTFLFSDGFHPTIYGYQLLAQQVSTKLREAGWQ